MYLKELRVSYGYSISGTRDPLLSMMSSFVLSGGEQKRVSIVEIMTARGLIQPWGNSRLGSSTTLLFVKGPRIATDVLGWTTPTTIYQTGEGICVLFDKAVALDHGCQVYYFGPPPEARTYFDGLGFEFLPRQSIGKISES